MDHLAFAMLRVMSISCVVAGVPMGECGLTGTVMFNGSYPLDVSCQNLQFESFSQHSHSYSIDPHRK